MHSMKRLSRGMIAAASSFFVAAQLHAQLPRAIFTDPPRDSVHPARMQVLHIPSGRVNRETEITE
ncbi:MAG: hypothetical protein ABIQ55_06855 [Gemmatimonadaceae bacterium]